MVAAIEQNKYVQPLARQYAMELVRKIPIDAQKIADECLAILLNTDNAHGSL